MSCSKRKRFDLESVLNLPSEIGVYICSFFTRDCDRRAVKLSCTKLRDWVTDSDWGSCLLCGIRTSHRAYIGIGWLVPGFLIGGKPHPGWEDLPDPLSPQTATTSFRIDFGRGQEQIEFEQRRQALHSKGLQTHFYFLLERWQREVVRVTTQSSRRYVQSKLCSGPCTERLLNERLPHDMVMEPPKGASPRVQIANWLFDLQLKQLLPFYSPIVPLEMFNRRTVELQCSSCHTQIQAGQTYDVFYVECNGSDVWKPLLLASDSNFRIQMLCHSRLHPTRSHRLKGFYTVRCIECAPKQQLWLVPVVKADAGMHITALMELVRRCIKQTGYTGIEELYAKKPELQHILVPSYSSSSNLMK